MSLRSRATSAPHIWTKLSPAKPTIVLDTYWKFAVERQEVFLKRVNGKKTPWTTDPIIQQYRFTNAFRASDRVSQYLIRNVIYGTSRKPFRDVFFRVILFKFFNKVETWEMLSRHVDLDTYDGFDSEKCGLALSDAMSKGHRIFSSAYIMPSGGNRFPGQKHLALLLILELMMREHVYEQIAEARTMRRGFEILREIPLLGDFLAYQFITDLNYSEHLTFSEMEFVIPGPGAKDGLRKCFNDFGGLNESEMIKFVTDKQADEFGRLGLSFQSLWGRSLQLIDCQNIFCEVDKYARVAHPNVNGISGRTRIKRSFRPSEEPVSVWFPPKWGLNDRLPKRG